MQPKGWLSEYSGTYTRFIINYRMAMVMILVVIKITVSRSIRKWQNNLTRMNLSILNFYHNIVI